MFRSDHHVGCAIKCVGASRVNTQHLIVIVRQARIVAFGNPFIEFVADIEIDFGTGAATDPVALQFLDAVRPIESFKVLLKAISVSGDAKHPLSKWSSFNRVLSTFALAINDLFVGKDCTQSRTPIDQFVGLVSQSMFIAIGRDRCVALRLDLRGNR